MSENVGTSPQERHQTGGAAHRSHPAPQYTHRLSISFAPDQVQNLQLVKTAFRMSEAGAIRAAFDMFCRSNGFPVNPNGAPNGR